MEDFKKVRTLGDRLRRGYWRAALRRSEDLSKLVVGQLPQEKWWKHGSSERRQELEDAHASLLAIQEALRNKLGAKRK